MVAPDQEPIPSPAPPVVQRTNALPPDVPEFEVFQPPIGQGTFGPVWIVRNAIGQWRALKAIYLSKFEGDAKPYEAEFVGLQRNKPVSEMHPGLMRIELISKIKPEGCFYYVMELADARVPGWEAQPATYQPMDLDKLRKQSPGHRLQLAECLRIIIILANTLDFLHRQGLIHRDIKPANVILVKGRPKLADIGLVSEVRPLDRINTMVGTPGYIPLPPERPGTVQADIYALGMVLYVISTGKTPRNFPDLPTTLMGQTGHREFFQIDSIIIKACQLDLAQRYPSAAAMLTDLMVLREALKL